MKRAPTPVFASIRISPTPGKDALNLDGGGSTALAIGDGLVNTSSDNSNGRAIGSNLAIFAQPMQ